MKRDVDLVRELLLDIERRGDDCPLDALRKDFRHDTDERTQHHLWLLIDAGWVKEVERPTVGAAGIRLTHAGHEFIELARSDARWHDATAIVIEQTGGLSLTVLRALLIKRAWQDVVRSDRRRVRRGYRRYFERVEPTVWPEDYADDSLLWDDDQARMLPRRQRYGVAIAGRNGWDADLYSELNAELAHSPPAATLPDHII